MTDSPINLHWLLKIPPRLKLVATLPCETIMFYKLPCSRITVWSKLSCKTQPLIYSFWKSILIYNGVGNV